VIEIGAGDGGNRGNDLVMLDLAEIAANQRVLHRFMNEMDVEQPGRIGNDRVAAIEDADLHHFPG